MTDNRDMRSAPDDLVERLRRGNNGQEIEAADRIEALTAEVARLEIDRIKALDLVAETITRAVKAEAERDAAVEALEKSEIMFRIRGQNSMADEVSTTIAKIKEGKL